MSDEEPIGRARWVGPSDDPPRPSMPAKRKQAGHVFAARGGPSDWHTVYRLEAMERFACDPEMEVEWYAE